MLSSIQETAAEWVGVSELRHISNLIVYVSCGLTGIWLQGSTVDVMHQLPMQSVMKGHFL